MFLDGRYLEKKIQSSRFSIDKIHHKKHILKHLAELLPSDELVTIEKQLPHNIYERLTLPDQEHQCLFVWDEDDWQSAQRVIKTPNQRAKIQQAITLTTSIREYVERMIHS